MPLKARKGKNNLMIHKRIKILYWLFVIWAAILFIKLIHINFFIKEKLMKIREIQINKKIELTAKRGLIYDRNSIVLANNIHCYSIYANPQNIKNREKISHKLGEIANISSKYIFNRIASNKRKFTWIKRKIKDDIVIEKIKDEKLEGIGILPEIDRVYPKGFLASSIIGFVGIDNQGLTGIEFSFEKSLRGEPKIIEIEKDALGSEIPQSIRYMKQALNGKNIFLTIDERIQHFLEAELEKAINVNGAKGAIGIVMDISTGEILGMASLPNFDPNNYTRYNNDYYKNKAVSKVWEPGSIFKIITASAAIDSGTITLKDTFMCHSYLQIGKHRISDAEPTRGGHGNINIVDIIVKSCNVGASLVSFKMKQKIFQKYIRKFGFGKKTGISLPGEEIGILPTNKKWSKIQLANISFGQGIAVTAIQLVVAFASIINDGNMVKPAIIKKIVDKNGEIVYEHSPKIVKKVISLKTSRILKRMMRAVVERGTGKEAEIPEFHSAGKTGTAQIADKSGGYFVGRYNSSFIGFFPYKNPKYLMLIVFEEPKCCYYGGVVAAPVFRRVAQRILWYEATKNYALIENDGKTF